MISTVEVVGWVLAAGAIAAAAVARHQRASLAEAVARTCHELRGPLTAARLGIVLALRGGQPADPRLLALELDLGRATLAVEDLSEVSAARRGRAAVTGEEVNVAQLLAESVQAWRGLATAHDAQLQLMRSCGRPVVLGERLRLAQAIGNLVANAVEHGGGTVRLAWRVDADKVLIEVTDEGHGLPAPVTELIRRRRRNAGSRHGHGIAVASAIAVAHGGRLTSAPRERGARLVLELPRM